MSFTPHIMRRIAGPRAIEIFALCRPDPSESEEVGLQTEQAYRSMGEILRAEGASPKHVVHEWVHFRHIRQAMKPFWEARQRTIGRRRGPSYYLPASTFVEQPPLNLRLHLELAFHAVIPRPGERKRPESVSIKTVCGCGECLPPAVRMFSLDEFSHLRAGNICGVAGSPYNEAFTMYQAAEEALRGAGMTFRDVVRTWIYLRDIGRDYAEFNRARRDFYSEAGISLLPASTGIAGEPYASSHSFLMSLYAIKAPRPLNVQAMTTPTLNEAPVYGSDFSRGLRVEDGNKITLLVSGTASVDDRGRTAHVGDLSGQLDRMLLNVSTLLSRQGATFKDLVLLTTYLKDQTDAAYLRDILHYRGLDDLPNVLVRAAICRSDLLCEMEAVAVLPLPH